LTKPTAGDCEHAHPPRRDVGDRPGDHPAKEATDAGAGDEGARRTSCVLVSYFFSEVRDRNGGDPTDHQPLEQPPGKQQMKARRQRCE
jgi:hypothetical protein